MSNDLGVVIKIDVPGVASTISTTEQQLSRVEAKGPAISQSLSKGMAEGATAADRLGKATKDATTPFDGLVAALKREQDMLTQIQAPVQRYTQDLQTLDSLLAKNRISTEQYAAEVTKLNKALGEKPEAGGEHGEAINPLEMMSGAGLAGAVGLGAVFEGVSKLNEVIEEMHKLDDEFIVMTNHAQKFADSMHSTNDVIVEEMNVAGQLHTSLEGVGELYDHVRDGSEGLNLTHREQIELTRTLGEAVQLANRPMEEAGALMSRFAFAMDTGTISGRELKSMMRDVPEIGHLWEETFHKSGAELMDAVTHGQISIKQLVQATLEHGDALDKLYAKQQPTLAQIRDYDKAMVDVAASQHRTQDGIDALGDRFNNRMTPALHSFNELLANTIDKFKEQDRAMADAAQSSVDAAVKWTQAMTIIGKAVSDTQKESRKVQQDAFEHSPMAKVLHDINDPLKNWTQDTAALNTLLKQGKIDADQYATELDKLAKSAPASVQAERTQTGQRIDAALRRHALAAAGSFDPESSGFLGGNLDTGGPATPVQLPPPDPNAQRALELYNSTRTAAEKYKDELAEVNKLSALGNINDEAKVRILDDLATKFGKIRSPSEEYARALKDLNDKMAVGLVSEGAYSEALDQLNIKFGKGDFATGLRQGVRDLAKEMDSSASSIGKVMKDTVDGINKNIADMVTKGKADFGSLAKTIENELIQIALKQAESGIFSSLAGGSGGGGDVLGGLGAAIGGGATGGEFDIPHAATGGAWVARQQSGQDTHLAMFHVRAGENVQIRTPEQMEAQRGGGSPVIQNHQRVVVQHDQRALLDTLDTPDGHTMFVKLAMANRGVIKAIAQ